MDLTLKEKTWRMIKQKYSYFLWGTPLLFAASIPIGIYIQKEFDTDNVVWFFFGPALPLFILWWHLYGEMRKQFYKEYAASLGFSYSSFVIPDKFEGSLFKQGNSQTVNNLIKGDLADKETQIFDYTYTVGSGKSKQKYDFTVVEITFGKQLPFFALREKNNNIFRNRPKTEVKNGVKVELEGDFYKHFDLEIEKEFEIETLQIFTPDIMAELCDKWSHLSLETSDDRMYIYENRHIETSSEMDSLLSLAKHLIIKMKPIEDFLSRDVAGLRDLINKKNDTL